MRLWLAHDYFTQRGGAERVAIVLAQGLSAENVMTSVCQPSQTFPQVTALPVSASPLQRAGLFRRDPRLAFPLLKGTWERSRVPSSIDAIVCSSSGWSHHVKVPESVPKVVYCHNPPRWLYQADEYMTHAPVGARAAATVLRASLTRADRAAAQTATKYLANSSSVRDRISRAYGIQAEVVYPPPGITETNGPSAPPDDVAPGFFLCIGRGRGYKNVDLVAGAAEVSQTRVIIVGGHPDLRPSRYVTVLDSVDDAALRWLYANCRANVTMALEDFGLTPVEAYTFGKPSIALKRGGFLDSIRPGVTGTFVPTMSVEDLATALSLFDDSAWDPGAIRRVGNDFSEDQFVRRISTIVESCIR